MADTVVRFAGIDVTFFRGDTSYTALRDVSLELREGEIFCLLGPTGCGKTTVLNLLAGFERPSAGVMELDGRPIEGPSRERAVVFQGDDSLFQWLTARDNVAFGPRMRGLPPAECYAAADRYLALVGLKAHSHKHPSEMSGGMKQRVQIARVLANEPRMLLMDEPFGALDAQTRRVMQRELIEIWRATCKTVLFITHDIEEAIVLGSRIGVMQAGPASRIKAIIEIDPAMNHDRTNPRFLDYYRQVHELIEGEVTRALSQELS